MPYASDAQRRYFNANRASLERQGVSVDEWNRESRGLQLPARARAGGGSVADQNKPLPEEEEARRRIYERARRAFGGAIPEMAFGGLMPGPNPPGLKSRGLFKSPRVHKGPIGGNTMGRGDKVGMGVSPGSYVLPADHVSGLGQGNTAAGFKVLDTMFNKGPYGTNIAKIPHGGSTLPKAGVKQRIAEGGEVFGMAPPEEEDQPVDIMAADGEYVLSPEQIMAVWGDLEKGHKALDEWVLYERRQHINKLKSLPGPVKN